MIAVIDTTREVYDINQLKETAMTVGELIEILQDTFNEDDRIVFRNDNGYTYGNIYEENIEYASAIDGLEEE